MAAFTVILTRRITVNIKVYKPYIHPASLKWSQVVSVISLSDLQIKYRVNTNEAHMLCVSVRPAPCKGKTLSKHLNVQQIQAHAQNDNCACVVIIIAQSHLILKLNCLNAGSNIFILRRGFGWLNMLIWIVISLYANKYCCCYLQYLY